MPEQTVLVTGAAGFIGSHLCRALLERGNRVVGIDNFDPYYARRDKEANISGLTSDRFTFAEIDICDASAMSELFKRVRPGAVHHLAALAGVRSSIESPARYANVNVSGSINVLEAARVAGCRNILFASSSSVYGERSSGTFAETDRADEPISPYAATKRAGEMICHANARLYGLSIGCLRFFTVYGPSQRPDLAIAKFMRLIARDEPAPMFGDGAASRDYTFIDDIITGVMAAESRVRDARDGFFRIWNLGGSSPIALSDMIAAIGRIVGREPRIDRQPAQPGDVARTSANLSRSRVELGYRPAMPFDEGLGRQWEWLRKRL